MTAAAGAGVVVRASDLSLRFPSGDPRSRALAVDGVNFELLESEVLAVVGETGSGKSSLATAVALGADITALEDSPRIVGGKLEVLGTQVRGISGRKRDRLSLFVGHVPQDAGDTLSPRLTVEENVADPIFSRDRKFDPVEAGELVATVVDAVRLPLKVLDRYPHELSKGQRQRVAIARALILEPRLLVADDPTAGIDVTVRTAILDTIVSLQQERGFSVLIVTADLTAVHRVSDRVAVMHRGRVVAIGTLDEVLSDPTHPYVRSLAASVRG